MSYSEEVCTKVYEVLKSAQEFLARLEQEADDIEESYNQELAALAERAKQKKAAEQGGAVSKLNAFISIAKAHAVHLVDNGGQEPYDTGVLSRLMVQINNSSRSDPFAEQLYTHAVCQLRGVQAQTQNIQVWMEREKARLWSTRSERESQLDRKKRQVSEAMEKLADSRLFAEYVRIQKDSADLFHRSYNGIQRIAETDGLDIGYRQIRIPSLHGYARPVVNRSQGVLSSDLYLRIPLSVDLSSGCGILTEYSNETEAIVLEGIQNLILNLLRYGECEQIIYIDPVRCNNSALGILQPLAAGEEPAIDPVPVSREEIRKKIASLIERINADERKLMNGSLREMPRRVVFLHNFPHAYDSETVSRIQQLFANAGHNRVTVVAACNVSARNSSYQDTMDTIRGFAGCIRFDGQFFRVPDTNDDSVFLWYALPDQLPGSLMSRYVTNRPVRNTGTRYMERVGMEMDAPYRKGIRRLENIPYGVDAAGNVLSLSFEDSNFATFLCGASRSGKSTMLHTLITGIIKNNHPDDVEMWLIDFKMTEFSRYIEHLPPHVRYIILDESPELVYDIIDRLTEILIKRQNAFKGKWQKLSEVPPEKYMPAMFIIIDEFSVMSQIVADSLTSSNENYSVKLQTLLAKGAALGMHFIFASQGFTSGTRGLNDFSKKQIQQRIAMKTEYNEIKETLDLKSASDGDRAMMEQLPVHQALVRIPVDDQGNHLKQAKVLYIDDYARQEEMIDRINAMVRKAPKYDVYDPGVYIDKKPLILDGANYTSFAAKKNLMQEYLSGRRNYFDRDEVTLFIGEPRRMLPLYPIVLNNGFCENMIVVAPIAEKMAASSVMMSIAQSLNLAGREIDVWSTRKNEVYRQVILECRQKVSGVYTDLSEVCGQIRSLKNQITNREEGEKFILLFGTETLLMDMSFQTGSGASEARSSAGGSVEIEKRAPGEMDLNALLASLGGGSRPAAPAAPAPALRQSAPTSGFGGEYDAREDLKFLLTQGPRLGYHFILLFNTAGELNQSRIDLSLFRHKVLFRMAKTDAMGIIGAANAGVAAELEDHSFRYTNGIDGLSFRPYLHPGLAWDGWSMNGETAENDEEEEYLM